jgi:integrase
VALYRAIIRGQIRNRTGAGAVNAIRLEDLNQLHIEAWREAMIGDGLAPKTVRNALSMVRTALRHAVRSSLIATSPAEFVELPRVPRNEPGTWTAGDLALFLEHVRGDRLSGLWHLAATTGLRRGELLGLRWADIDLPRASISVVRQRADYAGTIYESAPKTEAGRRRIALDTETVRSLADHRRRQLEERIAWGEGYEDHGLVFCREDGSPISPAWLSRRLRHLAAAARLPRLTPHGLRHTWATLALQAGVHPRIVAGRLGHASVALTLDRYSHVIDGLDRLAAEDVASRIAGGLRS